MTSSRSRTSRSSIVVVALALAFVGWVVVAPSSAEAGGRKRVVVLELDGPKAEKFHDGLIKLLKKTHTVVPLDKWNSTADDLGATRRNDKDVKKVAKKLKIDAVVFGKVDKRRDAYIISLQIRAGRSGQVVGNRIDTKAEGPRIDGKASRDLKDELVDAISNLESARSSGGGDDEEEDEEEVEKPAKKSTKKSTKKSKAAEEDEEEDEDEEAKPAKKGFSRKAKATKQDDEEDEEDEEAAKPAKKGFARKGKPQKKKSDDEDSEDEDDDSSSRKKKKVASSDDEDDEDDEDSERISADADDDEEMDEDEALTLRERAIDAVVGLSFNMRRMSFTYDGDLASKPPPYKGVPVAGIYVDGTVFPLAVSHDRRDMLKNFGITAMYDRVLKIESKSMGTSYPTAQARYAVGVAFRYPIGDKAVIGARLRYGRQTFNIDTAGAPIDIPNVRYTIVDPAVTFAVVAAPKITIDGKLAFMAITNTGQIQRNDQYGAATVKGFEGEVGGSYMLSRNIFARAAFKLETIGFEFGGNGMLSTGRDPDPEQDVHGARDSYYGGSLAVGALY